MVECTQFCFLMYDRPHDIHAVLDQLGDIKRDILSKEPRFSPNVSVILYGHSTGSEGVQSAAGVSRDLNFDGIPDVNLPAHPSVVGDIAASTKGPFSPACRQNDIHPRCHNDDDCTDLGVDLCFFPLDDEAEGGSGSCIAPDDPDLECPYGEPWTSPVCNPSEIFGDLCRRNGNLGFTTSSWTELEVPTLYLTGGHDTAGGQHPSERRSAAEHPSVHGSYLFWFPEEVVDLDHNFYALGNEAWDPYYEIRLVSAALAFADMLIGRRITDRRSGRYYLNGGGPIARDPRGDVEFGCY